MATTYYTVDYITETGRMFDFEVPTVDFGITEAVALLGNENFEGETVVKVAVREYMGQITTFDGKTQQAFMQKFVAAI